MDFILAACSDAASVQRIDKTQVVSFRPIADIAIFADLDDSAGLNPSEQAISKIPPCHWYTPPPGWMGN